MRRRRVRYWRASLVSRGRSQLRYIQEPVSRVISRFGGRHGHDGEFKARSAESIIDRDDRNRQRLYPRIGHNVGSTGAAARIGVTASGKATLLLDLGRTALWGRAKHEPDGQCQHGDAEHGFKKAHVRLPSGDCGRGVYSTFGDFVTILLQMRKMSQEPCSDRRMPEQRRPPKATGK